MEKSKTNQRKAGVKAGKPTTEVVAVRGLLKHCLDQIYPDDPKKRRVGKATFGVYAFFDYDGEPIYVGKTYEGLSARIHRHITNQRTDPVAMNVLDPFEVYRIKLWPLFDLGDAVEKCRKKSRDRKQALAKANEHLCKAEYATYQELLEKSKFHAVLNEKDIDGGLTDLLPLPTPADFVIVPEEVYEARKHPDHRIARRAATIARLTQVISERKVSKGLRRTLVTQAKRLLDLADKQFEAMSGEIPVEGIKAE